MSSNGRRPRLHARIGRHWRSGQGMVEYALILVLVAIVVLIVLISTGQAFKNLYSDVTTQLNIQAGL